jgi:small subunit ribosomal protein S8
MFNHSVSSLVSSIKNGIIAKRSTVSVYRSNIAESILKVLKNNGYISNYSKDVDNKTISIHLKYYTGKSSISDIKVISKPSRRVYCRSNNIPVVYDGLGIVILSTSKGVMCSVDSNNLKAGGELLLQVF